MAHPLRNTVQDFVEGLKTFEKGFITSEAVRRYMEDMRLSAEALWPYAHFREQFYTRNLVYRDSLFEVMVICWMAGQKTPIHTHNGQLGWMAVAQGEMSVHNYKYLSCDHPEFQNVVGIDCLAGATQIELDRLTTDVCAESSPIACVDKQQSIHQIENADRAQAGCISLHVYSLPIDSCVGFDLEKQKCFRKTLNYFSRYGQVELEVEVPRNPLPIIS
jgi:cysteine dioxygenase